MSYFIEWQKANGATKCRNAGKNIMSQNERTDVQPLSFLSCVELVHFLSKTFPI